MVGALVCFSCSPAPVDRPDAGNPVDGGSDSGVDAGAIDSGPPSCDGCWRADGGCLALNRTTVQECGPVGQACTPCYPSDLCSLGVCETNGEPTQIGASCFDKAYCERGFGPEAICKLTTTSGNDTYLNGLCTLPCGSAPCPVGSICVVFPLTPVKQTSSAWTGAVRRIAAGLATRVRPSTVATPAGSETPSRLMPACETTWATRAPARCRAARPRTRV